MLDSVRCMDKHSELSTVGISIAPVGALVVDDVFYDERIGSLCKVVGIKPVIHARSGERLYGSKWLTLLQKPGATILAAQKTDAIRSIEQAMDVDHSVFVGMAWEQDSDDRPYEDRLFDALTPPDMVGSSEYLAVYELLQTVVESACIGNDDPRQMVMATLDLLYDCVEMIRQTEGNL